MTIAERLREIALFAHFSDAQLAVLAPGMSRTRFPPGVLVIRQGDTTSEAYVVDAGAIRIQRDTPYGNFALATLGPGEMFGEASFLDGDARSGDAWTESETELLVLNPLALEALVAREPRIGMALHWALWKSLSQKLRATNERLTRFFQESGRPVSTVAPAPGRSAGEFRVAMRDKRSLFQEQKLASLEINFLATLSREEQLAPGQVLFREGDAADRMYVVLDGRVMISKYIPGAGEEALGFLERGDYFGEMALIDRAPRSADAKAHDGGAVVLGIPRNAVESLLDMGKVSSLRLLRILCSLVAKRLREVDEKIVGWFILAGGSGGSAVPPPEVMAHLAALAGFEEEPGTGDAAPLVPAPGPLEDTSPGGLRAILEQELAKDEDADPP